MNAASTAPVAIAALSLSQLSLMPLPSASSE
jgi:hypothetical protein